MAGENHIPVDRVAGTSMGSIIGAMYATGMSPDEIQQFAERIDWDEAFLPETVYSQVSFRRKQAPNGFNAGQGVGLLLDRIAFPQSGVTSFDDLPIPFRCVAIDMLSGEGIVLRDGPLAQAGRASMAIPGVFTPVEINGHDLAGGGIVQNLPVETVRAMDPDVVIAVELRLPPGDPKQLETLTGVLTRGVDVMIAQHERRSLALANASVPIGMGTFVATDYSHVKDLVELGYKTAASQSAALLRYAIKDPGEWQEYLAARSARKQRPPNQVDVVEVVGAVSNTDSRIQHRPPGWAMRVLPRMASATCGSRRTTNLTVRRSWTSPSI